jgi:hypothetical protein
MVELWQINYLINYIIFCYKVTLLTPLLRLPQGPDLLKISVAVFEVNMDILLVLPAEISLQIISHLYLDDLLSLRSVCRFWKDFFGLHESTIYHAASDLHNIIPLRETPLCDLNSMFTERSLIGVDGWKSFCM